MTYDAFADEIAHELAELPEEKAERIRRLAAGEDPAQCAPCTGTGKVPDPARPGTKITCQPCRGSGFKPPDQMARGA